VDVIEKISGKPAKKKAEKAPVAATTTSRRGRRPLHRTGSDLSASDED